MFDVQIHFCVRFLPFFSNSPSALRFLPKETKTKPNYEQTISPPLSLSSLMAFSLLHPPPGTHSLSRSSLLFAYLLPRMLLIYVLNCFVIPFSLTILWFFWHHKLLLKFFVRTLPSKFDQFHSLFWFACFACDQNEWWDPWIRMVSAWLSRILLLNFDFFRDVLQVILDNS